MKTRAAVAWQAGQPLTIEEVDLAGPRESEVLVEVKASGICHTDQYTLSGADPEGLFPAILGHEGAGVVLEVGAGVTTVKAGDHVIPLYTPECRQCKFCLSRKTNLCQQIRSTQGRGLMPDGTSRFSLRGQPILHYMGTSTFANHIVVPEIAVARIRSDAPFDKVCYIGCGVTTGVGAVIFTAKVEAGANVVVFGLGGIGLNVIQGARLVGADKIVGIDLNPAREAMARKFGMTHFVNPSAVANVVDAVVQLTDGGADYSFECIGNTTTMRQALECCHKGWGQSIIIGVAAAGQEISTRPFQLVTGRQVEGLGLRRGARPHRCAEDRRLVHGGEDQHRRPDHPPAAAGADQRRVRPDAARRVDPLGGHLLGRCGRGQHHRPERARLLRWHAGLLPARIHRHRTADEVRCLSPAAGCGRACPRVVLPRRIDLHRRDVRDQGRRAAARRESRIDARHAGHEPAPDGRPGADADWEFGDGAGFYLDALRAPWRQHWQMETYVAGELPALIFAEFAADPGRAGIFGHSMGGHGALTLGLRHPQLFRSISAFAPIATPSQSLWGCKAFDGYLGSDRSTWHQHDATALIAAGARAPEILVDQGLADKFLPRHLGIDSFAAACRASGQPLTLRQHEGYDHGYYFIATLVAEHIAHHAAALK